MFHKGDHVRHRETGQTGTVAADQEDGGITVRQDDGATTVWPADDAEQLDALRDLIEAVAADVKAGGYRLPITPGKYGFKTEDEYWDAVRRLAGLA